MSLNRVIGAGNRIPWHLPEDFKWFKQMTTGQVIVVGRRTFDSIGKPLPGRTTVVVTRNRELKIEGCIIVHSLQQAIDACTGDNQPFIVGGAELYAQALPLTKILFITEIQMDVEGDAHFPEFERSEWIEESRERRSQQEPQALEYHFVTYRRK